MRAQHEINGQAVIAEMVDTEKLYEEARVKCQNKLNDILFLISCVDDYQERIVLEYRYIHYYGWVDIAIRLDFSVQNVYKIHGKALLDLLKILEKMSNFDIS